MTGEQIDRFARMYLAGNNCTLSERLLLSHFVLQLKTEMIQIEIEQRVAAEKEADNV